MHRFLRSILFNVKDALGSLHTEPMQKRGISLLFAHQISIWMLYWKRFAPHLIQNKGQNSKWVFRNFALAFAASKCEVSRTLSPSWLPSLLLTEFLLARRFFFLCSGFDSMIISSSSNVGSQFRWSFCKTHTCTRLVTWETMWHGLSVVTTRTVKIPQCTRSSQGPW